MTRKTVVIAQDERITREAVRALLAQDPFLEVVAEVGAGPVALQAVHLHRPDLLLLDLPAPISRGLEVIRAVRKESPETRVLVLTVNESDDDVYDGITAGAHGYCIKDADGDELLLAVKRVLEGKRYLSLGIADAVPSGGADSRSTVRSQSPFQRLTRRERQILKLVAEGFTNKRIAEDLAISFKTVEKHRSNLMTKLGLHTAARLTAYAIERGIVSTGSFGVPEPSRTSLDFS
jgi:DNA-binding NarL/FixJ family response regulator